MTPDRVLTVARGELGTTESPRGSNRTKYGVFYGLNGQPWCAIFVWCVFKACGIDLRQDFTRQWASTLAAKQSAQAKGRIVPVSVAEPGDIVIYDFPGGRAGADHMGILVENHYKSARTIVAIEGNTSLGNQSNGGQVLQRSRATSIPMVFVRPYWQVIDPPAAKSHPPGPQLPPATSAEAELARLVALVIFATKLSIIEHGPLRQGDGRRNEVTALQKGINGWIQDRGRHLVVDGIYGPQTTATVQFFQAVWGLAPDGIVGLATANRIWP